MNRKIILSVFVLMFLLQSIVCVQFSVFVGAAATSTAVVDVFSQKGGNGPNQPDGYFVPKELVILYAHATNNSAPIQDKIVSFTIYGPRNPYYNISIYRTAQTNASGVAKINFTIPHPCEYPEEVVYGKWTVYAKVQLLGPDPDDLLTFMVLEEHDVAVKSIALSKTIVCQGYSMSINATIKNQGRYSETFNVTVYANTTVIGTQTLDNMPNGTSTVLTYIWDTEGFAKGNYIISANATIVTNETFIDNNFFTDGTVRVNMVGDVEPPYGIVDIVDIVGLATIFGAEKGEPWYDPNRDIDCNGVIDIVDMVIIAIHFGETDP